MVKVDFGSDFKKIFKKINNNSLKIIIKKKIRKIVSNPQIGKPMMHERKGTREVYVKPFRLSYVYLEEENKIVFFGFIS